jgi:hypothetical protein
MTPLSPVASPVKPQPATLRLVEPIPRTRPKGRVVARVTLNIYRDASGVVSRDVVIEKTS